MKNFLWFTSAKTYENWLTIDEVIAAIKRAKFLMDHRVVSGDMFMRIFAGILWKESVKRQWDGIMP